MSTYVFRNGEVVDRETAPPLHVSSSAFSAISDEMAPTRHMADGKRYTSKAKFRAATRAHGCIEVGNETAHLLKPRKAIPLDRGKRVADIKQAIRQLQDRR